jgi:hypothetical protein
VGQLPTEVPRHLFNELLQGSLADIPLCQPVLRRPPLIYDADGRGDMDAILDRVSDDVDWAAEAASKTAPWHGPRAGKDGVHLLIDWTIRSAPPARRRQRAAGR